MSTLLSRRAGAIIALIAANVIWGTTSVVTKPLLERVPPLTVATSRFAVAVAILVPLLLLTGRRPALGRIPALMGFVGVFLVYLCQNAGLEYTTAANGSLIHGGIPALTAVLAALLVGERLSGRNAAGIAASLVGVTAVVVLKPGAEFGISALGDVLVLASALALAGYFVVGRRAFASCDPVALAAGVASFGLLFLLPTSVVELAVRGMTRPTVGDLLGLLYLGIGASALAFVLWGYGLRHLAAGQAATFANLTPLVGVGVAALLLGEPIAAVQLGGGLLILGGVWLATGGPAGARVPSAPAGSLGGEALVHEPVAP